ncbi:MAG: single-stranded DNA-binding protein [Propionibacteriaceae bacterium]|nr:single-stranded DNA-binding protein [Propionibacteriaceae bacterium]
MESTVTLTGYVGNEIEKKTTKAGQAFATFRVGTTPRVKRGESWADGNTTWTTVVCYRDLAQNVSDSVFKGDPVFVEGRVRTQAWVDKTGQNHERTVLEADTVGHDLRRGTATFRKTPFKPYGDHKQDERPKADADETLTDAGDDLAATETTDEFAEDDTQLVEKADTAEDALADAAA